MAYLVLARKWRPQTFDDLVGQEHVGRTLEKAIATGRVHHAFLFTGTRGVGKTTSARILAMALNCEKGPTVRPCGVCGSCKQIKSGSGLDVMEIDGASNRGIDDIRELREKISYTPAGGKFRIVIIDEVHMLTKEAFNALLKSLEEPPPNFIFIFATTDPHKVPETILSRIQRYDFKRISAEDIFKRIKFICQEEGIAFEEPALRFVAQKGNGSMRDALTLLDQVIPFCKEGITLAELKPVLGLMDQDLFLNLFKHIAEKNEAALLDQCAATLAEGIDAGELVSGMAEHVRNLLLTKVPNISANVLLLSPQEKKLCTDQASLFEAADLLRISELLSVLSSRLARSPLPRFELETALIKIARMDSAIDIARLLDGSTVDLKKKSPEPSVTASRSIRPSSPIYSPPSAPTQTAPGLPPEPPALEDETEEKPLPQESFTSDQVLREWKRISRSITSDHMQLGTFLTFSNCISSDDETIRIGLPADHRFQHIQLTQLDNLKKLEEWFKKRLQKTVRVQIELQQAGASVAAIQNNQPSGHSSSNQPAPMNSSAPSLVLQSRETINEAIKKEPIISQILDVFEGEVI